MVMDTAGGECFNGADQWLFPGLLCNQSVSQNDKEQSITLTTDGIKHTHFLVCDDVTEMFLSCDHNPGNVFFTHSDVCVDPRNYTE